MRLHRHTCNCKCFLIFIFFITSLGTISPYANATDAPDASESHPGIGRESRYAEAVIAYNKKQTDESVKILDELLKESPKNIEYLELKALALKGKGDEKASLAVYWQLFQEKPEKERGPYAYEIASILEKQKKPAEAKPYFQKAADLGFNVAASNLYMGLGEFNTSQYSEAEIYFNKVTASGIPELELVGRYYISLCYFKLNLGTRGIQELIEARDVANKVLKTDPKNTTALTIQDAGNKMLAPFSKGNWFGNAGVLTQYDSNIQTLPTASANTSAGGTNPATMKANLLAGLGYMSAPINTVQYVAGYRASYNHNFNSLTKAFEYFTNTGSLFLNYRALARTTYGLKFESSYTFQNALNPGSTTEYGFQKYNLSLTVGPYLRYQLGRYWRAEVGADLRKQTNYSDPNQSGTNTNINLALRQVAGDKYLNPGFSLLRENNNVSGSQDYYSAYGLGLSNSMSFPGQITFAQNFDFLFTYYSKTLPVRTDTNLTFRVSVIKQLTPKISLLADFTYIDNLSSYTATNTYNRMMTSAGVVFSL